MLNLKCKVTNVMHCIGGWPAYKTRSVIILTVQALLACFNHVLAGTPVPEVLLLGTSFFDEIPLVW